MDIHNSLTSNQCHILLEIKTMLIKSLTVNKPWQTLIYSIHMTMFCFIMQVTS